MKIRTDFVTNSSSSSFILAYNNKEEAIKEIENTEMLEEARKILLRDIDETTPRSKEDLKDILNDECEGKACTYLDLGEGGWLSSNKDTWQNNWKKANPGKSVVDMWESPEYKEALHKKTKEYVAEIKKEIGDKEYVLYLEYGDECGMIYSELEHEIVPCLPGTIGCFSHH